MTFRLDPATLSSQKLRAGVEKALQETAALLAEPPEGRHHAVHEARKTLKRLRALYRLLAHQNREVFDKERGELRDAARHLAKGRDAAALAETSRWLIKQARKADETALLERLSVAMERRRDAMPETVIEADIAEAVECLQAAAGRTEHLSIPDSRKKTARLIAGGWARALRKARRTLSPVTVDSPAEAFHDLRKAAQVINAYHALLKPLWPHSLSARQEKLRELIDTLGRENDLHGLARLMEAEPGHFGEPIEQVILQRIITRRREALRLAALQQGATLFATDPDEDAKRIAILWAAL